MTNRETLRLHDFCQNLKVQKSIAFQAGDVFYTLCKSVETGLGVFEYPPIQKDSNIYKLNHLEYNEQTRTLQSLKLLNAAVNWWSYFTGTELAKQNGVSRVLTLLKLSCPHTTHAISLLNSRNNQKFYFPIHAIFDLAFE